MLNLTTNWLRSIGLLPIPLTPEQIRRQKLCILAWRIRADQMNALYRGTGYSEPFKVIGISGR